LTWPWGTERRPQFTTTDIFSWQHIDYTIPIVGQEDQRLLSDISGYVAPGKLTALMGESGAGKTTLLNVLAQRISIGIMTGDRFVNDCWFLGFYDESPLMLVSCWCLEQRGNLWTTFWLSLIIFELQWGIQMGSNKETIWQAKWGILLFWLHLLLLYRYHQYICFLLVILFCWAKSEFMSSL
jgi:hypothetical protein